MTKTVDVPDLRRADHRPLVDIISGSFGAGHDAAAREIAVRFERRGYATRTWDVVDLMPRRLGRGLRATYLRQIQSAPSTWRWLLRSLERSEGGVRLVERALHSAAGAQLEVAAAQPAAIVSTHPFASQALGELRAQGRLDVPVATYLTDMSVHRLWVHPGVDLHLALHAVPAAQAVRRGAARVRVIRPPVPLAFAQARHGRPRTAARRDQGLPAAGRLVLVTGGSCGIGDLRRSAADIAATGVAQPVVLCGRNERLRRQVLRAGAGHALGWVDDMPGALAAVDGVVQNAGGFTSLEALSAGAPVLTYRTIPGHGETNADALERSGLVPWARERDLLRPALQRLLAGRHQDPMAALRRRPDVVDAVAPARLPSSA
ncbi:MAG: MGDG synthase family glycosyltransferase [Nocardioidaceae bacterium]